MLQPAPKAVLAAIYDPEKLVFLVYARTKNVPAALGDIATRLGRAGVNILSVSDFSEPDKSKSDLGFFAEAKDQKMTSDQLSDILAGSNFIVDTHVENNESSFAVDDFGFPLTYFPGGRGILFPQVGITSMFQEVISTFGSGGEAILYRAGYTVGKQGTDDLAKTFGEEGILQASEGFLKLYNALGWGQMESKEVDDDFDRWTLRLTHSFECAGLKKSKPQVHFARGLIVGSGERLLKRTLKREETKCIAVGDSNCTFNVSPA